MNHLGDSFIDELNIYHFLDQFCYLWDTRRQRIHPRLVQHIEAYQKAIVDFTVNLLICFEGMEEYGWEGLDELIKVEAKKFFAEILR